MTIVSRKRVSVSILLAAAMTVLWANPDAVGGDQEFATLPLKRLFALHSKYLELPPDQRTLFAPSYQMHPKSGDLAGYSMSYTLDGVVTPVPIDSLGNVLMSPSRALMAANPLIVTNRPKGSMTLVGQIEILLPHATAYQVADLDAALSQLAAGMKKILGFKALLAGRPKRICFGFATLAPETAATGKVVFGSGKTTLLNSDADQRITFKPGDKKFRGAQSLLLSQAPVRIEICD